MKQKLKQNRRIWSRALKASALLALTSWALLSQSALTSQIAGKADSPSQSLFPKSNCAVADRMERSRKYLDETFSFVKIQGIFPWPDFDGRVNINGIWINEARGTYAVLRQVEDAQAPKYGALVIQFYSACTHQLLAEGKRVLEKRDWDTPSISIPLKNQKLNGKSLRAYVKVHAYDYEYLEISIREARVGIRDFFYLDRFQ